jgi:O-methyltransferase
VVDHLQTHQDVINKAEHLQALLGIVQGNHSQTIRELVAVATSSLMPQLVVSDRLMECLYRLYGTTTLEALYIVDGLRSSADVEGDVCEFGVANGRTSALIATTLVEGNSRKRLWLYDSFEGLPAPTGKDVLLNDIFGLGSAAAYKGQLSSPETEVLTELARVGLPASQAELCKGWVENSLRDGRHPSKVSFAFLDMDFYQATFDTLRMLVDCMPPGGAAVVDDYGFFSAGVETAVQEILSDYPGAFRLEHPFGFKFVTLRRN